MSKIFKRSDINIDSNNKVIIKHRNLPEGVSFKQEEDENENVDNLSIEKAQEIANGIIAKAKMDAEHIKIEAIEESDRVIEDSIAKQTEIYDEAKQNGYDDGYEEGHKAGVEIGEKSLEEIISLKETEIEEIKASRDNLITEVEEEIIDLVSDIIGNITYGAFQLNPSLLSVLVKRGINNATIQNKVSIKVSSEDYDAVIKNIDEFKKLVDSSKEVEILKDFSLMKNDCLLETEFGNINCGLDEQLNSVRESLYFILNDR